MLGIYFTMFKATQKGKFQQSAYLYYSMGYFDEHFKVNKLMAFKYLLLLQ